MEKRGFLLPEYVLKIVIAVLAIILLVYLAVMLYSSFFKTTELNKAKADLEHIEDFQMPKARSEGSVGFPLVSPKDWFLFSFQDSGEWCGGRCLCICPEQNKKSCEVQGACKKILISGAEQGIKLGVDFILTYNSDTGEYFIQKKNE